MVRFISIIMVLLWLALPGCALMLMNKVVNPSDLSPEQIKAYQQLDMNIFMCFQFGGPPPAGALTFFVWPKNKEMNQAFGPSCSIIQGK